MDKEPWHRTSSKFGYNFRERGQRDGRFAITSTAWILIGITLPIINIITLIILLAPTRVPKKFK